MNFSPPLGFKINILSKVAQKLVDIVPKFKFKFKINFNSILILNSNYL